jgi:hypothetical protein
MLVLDVIKVQNKVLKQLALGTLSRISSTNHLRTNLKKTSVSATKSRQNPTQKDMLRKG